MKSRCCGLELLVLAILTLVARLLGIGGGE